MSKPQLSIVQRHTPQPAAVSPARRVYEHWLFMFGKNALRTAFGPGRRRLLDAWLTEYDEETLRLAVDGAAADPWIGERGGRFTSIEWVLRDEAQIEQFAEAGERMRAAAATSDGAAMPERESEADGAEQQAARERLRQFAARRSGRLG